VTARLRHVPAMLWVVPAVALLGMFVYYPVLDNFRLSLFQWNAYSTTQKWVGLGNYTALAADPVFWRALTNNVFYAVTSVVVQVGFGLVLAGIVEEFVIAPLRGFFRIVYFVPVTISITVIGLLFLFLYNPQIGLIDQFLVGIGHPELSHAWLGEEPTAIWGIIAMSQWQSTGEVMVLFIVAMQRIPREYYDAAYVDGASKAQAWRHITVPLVRDMTAILMIITISGAFLVFNEIMATTSGGPNNASQVLATWLYQSAFFNDQMGYAAAIASVIFVITFVFSMGQLLLVSRQQVEY
jgi:raffinose/stachyose/melibiose transport system permease protein